MLSNMLNLRNLVQVRKTVESYDGFGGTTTSTTLTTLARASIWQPSSNDSWISDKITSISTHVLATFTSAYTFTDSDSEVIYAGNTYKIVGHQDDVANYGKLSIIGLERLS